MKRSLFNRRRNGGFTILEVAIAAGVMVMVISSSIIVMQSGFKALDNARKTTLASQITQSEMERIRMLNWTQVSGLPASPGYPTIALTDIFPQNTATEQKVLAEMQATFTATRTVTVLSADPNGLLLITVEVTWKGIDGITHKRSTNTRYCENGLYSYYYTVAS